MRICHLLASDTVEEDLVTIGLLLKGLAARGVEQCVAGTDGATAERARQMLGIEVQRGHLRLGGYVASVGPRGSAPWRLDLMHVWSGGAAPMKSLVGDDEPAVVVGGGASRPAPTKLEAYIGSRFRVATVVCDSQASRDRLIRRGYDADRCVVVPPGVDVESPGESRRALTREALGLSGDQPVLLTPGPASREAGQYYAVWATALLQQLFTDVRLILPGNSPESARLERFVRSFGLPQMLVRTRDQWPFRQLMGVADVLLAPVLTDLPTGAVVGAMGAGLPVVACDVPAMRERIDEGATGLLVPPKDPTKLAGAALRIIEDDGLRDRLVQAARRRVAEAYPAGRLVERYYDVYQRALARAGAFSMRR